MSETTTPAPAPAELTLEELALINQLLPQVYLSGTALEASKAVETIGRLQKRIGELLASRSSQ